MSLQARITFFLVCFLITHSKSLATEFTVDSWNLSVSVQNVPGDIAGHSFNQVQTPFVANHNVALPGTNSTVSASYDFAFEETAQLRRFLIESTLNGEGFSSGATLMSANSSSRINITPLVPITVFIHAEYTFDLPADPMFTTFGFIASGQTTQTNAFFDLQGFSTTMGPGHDTFTIDGQFVLQPTESWQLRAVMDIDMLSGTQGHFGTGSGFFDIQIVPEPATLAFLVPMMFLIRRKRRASS